METTDDCICLSGSDIILTLYFLFSFPTEEAGLTERSCHFVCMHYNGVYAWVLFFVLLHQLFHFLWQ